ncbi:phage tail sheath C-terminal domain-containing protein [Polyangium sp. y55x31]|uniref:phage tail sheath family protein n=1 Tax=Polyangium sp. y55x31 TaxID=3042688 RepID=UPI002482C66A|nr:phage tail sheath C-terminal domain-containing protein [Polyangium sp. y55x31]MDI1478927.1 phage tail sheath C-terminal domain-containing protein [Polyangium sp. y55x31]
MPTYRTPDVYVEEIPMFPPSVAEVGTAIPAFIGYTEKATKIKKDDLLKTPTKIYSMVEFQTLFGFPKADEIGVKLGRDDKGVAVSADITPPEPSFLLYYAVKLYFDNGGGQCYIVSVGNHDATKISPDDLEAGLNAVRKEDEPTILVIPEATKLVHAKYASLCAAMLKQCDDLRDRVALFDAWKGDVGPDEDVVIGEDGGKEVKKKVIEANRDAWTGVLKYGAAYYPFIKTSFNHHVNKDESNVIVTDDKGTAKLGALVDSDTTAYNLVKAELQKHYVVMPPSGAIAGVYAATDRARGVWKAPANVALADVIEPVVRLTNEKQDALNVDPTTGKSINAIRAFAGKGTLVWGARTLAGNDNEWRYVSVRRFFNMVEESIKKSTYWAVFEPNDANTWVKVRGMIENYLTDKWREGALAGASPKDAFFVRSGLGTTMSSQDILEGRMFVEIGMAVVRPAEFIVLRFFHKMQTS